VLNKLFYEIFLEVNHIIFCINPIFIFILMTYKPLGAANRTEAAYVQLFKALPGNSILLQVNAPMFTILATTPGYLKISDVKEEDLVGKGIFEVFPSNPNDSNDTGESKLRDSLSYVLQHKKFHELPIQRYDTRTEDGRFIERYWHASNTPVVTEDGAISYIIHTVSEITHLIRDEEIKEKLKGLELLYNIIMRLPAAVGLTRGIEHTLEMANESALRLWGKSSDILGKPLLQSIPELEGQGIIELFNKVILTGQSYTDNEVMITMLKKGQKEERYFDMVYLPYYGPDNNKPTGVFAMAHDVTEKVEAQKNLEEAKKEAERQKRLYETINGSTPDLIYVFDLNYRFMYANKALLTMWGSTWEQSIGKGLLENGYEPWHAEMHEREIDLVVATKKPIRGEVAFPHAVYGSRVYDYIFVPVFAENGEVESVAGTTRDITDLKLAERSLRESDERFRNLADDSPMFVFIIDAEAQAPVSYWNKTWLQYTGQSMEEAKGRAWDGIIHPDDVAEVMSHYGPAFHAQQAYYIPAVRVKRHDGVYRWHAFKGNPRFLANGTFNGYVGVGLDIHDQKLAQESLKQSEIQLQQKVAERTSELERTVGELRRSNTNLEEFAYAASHDLKEPIRKIHFFSERLKQSMGERMNPGEQNYFERLEGASKRMSSLIDDLLSYSQISLRPRVYDLVDMNQLMELVLEDLDLEIEDRSATVTVDKLFSMQGHQRQLQQAFQNLISNALKYSKPGKAPVIRINYEQLTGKDSGLDLGAEEQQKTFNCIRVSDNGIGFEQAEAERIFNVFTRLHGNAEYRGTGIGLSIVRKVIENHNGHIWASSVPGEGSIFHILLPADGISLP
jgi:PAS domain S-box-containing protein